MSQPARVLLALLLGLGLGIAAAAGGGAWVDGVVSVADPIGTAWLNGLRMTIVPLVTALLITGIAATAQAARAGGLALAVVDDNAAGQRSGLATSAPRSGRRLRSVEELAAEHCGELPQLG